LDRFAPSNRAVAARFFGRDALFLEPPPASDEPYFEFPRVSHQRLIRHWIAPVIRELVKTQR
jgi:hypothetical protein